MPPKRQPMLCPLADINDVCTHESLPERFSLNRMECMPHVQQLGGGGLEQVHLPNAIG